jgi:hypothetical protein
LEQVPPDIWNSILLEAKKWLLNERKRQQLEDEKLKKLSSINRDISKPSDGDTSTPYDNIIKLVTYTIKSCLNVL